jgi:D-aminopeptidase
MTAETAAACEGALAAGAEDVTLSDLIRDDGRPW